jgi:hypothetical protein
MKDFWNYNLNGITGFGKNSLYQQTTRKEVKTTTLKKQI